jgi:ABC-type Fe3+ transport system substrate-binding protein
MVGSMKARLRSTGLAIAASLALNAPAGSQTIDPAHAKAWDFMQQAMQGVPYDILKGACSEGTLTIYHGTWSDAQAAQIDAFRKRFPCVQVRPFELGTAARRERFLAETRANRFINDIVQDTDPGSLDELVDDGLIMNYVLSSDALYADAVKRKGYWYPLRIGISTNVWNTNLVSDEDAKVLYDWKGGVDPKWKGKVGIVEPTSGGAIFLPWYFWVKTYGPEFIRDLAKLEPRIFNLNQVGAALASGDIAVGIGISETPLTTMWLAGAPIKWSMPEPGVGPVTGQGIAAKAPHPNAAKLYHEYAFSAEGYEVWQVLGGPPARIDYSDKRKVASEPWFKYPKVWFQYDTRDATKARDEIIGLYKKMIVNR